MPLGTVGLNRRLGSLLERDARRCQVTNCDVRQAIAIMSTIILAPLAVIQLAIQPVDWIQYTAICSPFIGAIAWFYKKKEEYC